MIDVVCYIFATLLGLVIGSFLNVCIYRIPNHTFFNNTRSYCPTCKTSIKFYDNIPVFGYLFLGGKCRQCREHISFRYPLVEILNTLAYILLYYKFGVSMITIGYSILLSTLIVMTFIDIDTLEIPNGIHLIILAIGVLSFFWPDGIVWWHKLVGLIVVSLPLLIIGMATGGIGGGDIKLMFALGLIFGIKLTVFIGLISIIIGGILGVIYIINNRKNARGKELAFGPSIAIATTIAIFFGNELVNMYLNIFSL